MPWWSWILLWGALVLAMLGILGWLSFRLFTKFGRALVAFGDLAEKASALEALVDEVADSFEPAVLADAAALRHAREQQQTDRERRRQTRRDSRVRRGKLLVKADTAQFLHLIKRT
ncbi:MAG: hypothetical protein QOH55_2311 [Microbacteriaceae bacterium]|jgi:uncharacterized membrane protein YccC|nr:hypothetical protein [Microbacteriaceae bacterium]